MLLHQKQLQPPTAVMQDMKRLTRLLQVNRFRATVNFQDAKCTDESLVDTDDEDADTDWEDLTDLHSDNRLCAR